MLRREVYVKFAEALGIYGSVKSAQTSGGFSGVHTTAQPPSAQGQTITSRATGRQRPVYGDKLTLGRTTFDRYGNVDRTSGRYAQGKWRRV